MNNGYADTVNVIIGERKTYDDWGLKLLNLFVGFPDAKINQLDIPGADGLLDLTQSMGPVRYGNRELKLIFDITGDPGKWHAIASTVAGHLHGRRLKVILDSDPGYYYMGRLSISSEKSNYLMNRVTVTGDMEPYKYELQSSLEDWLWDPFDFTSGIIRNYKNLRVEGSLTVTIPGRQMAVVPTITASTAMTVAFRGGKHMLRAGEQKIYAITITEGDHDLIFTGYGTVSIDYRGGIL